RGMDEAARSAERAFRADFDLRGAPGILEAQPGRWLSLAVVSRAGAGTGGACEAVGIHARGISAGDGASVFRLVGLPGDGILRSDQPVWNAAGLQISHRLPAPAGHRGHSGLGSLALSRR